VPGRVRRLRVDHAREGGGDRVQAVIVGDEQAVRRLPAGQLRDRPRVLQRAPERAVVTRGAQVVDQCGVERAPAPGARHGERPAQPERLAGPVPVLVQRQDRLPRAGGQREHAGDLRAALAARADQLARDLLLGRDAAQPARLGQRRAARRGSPSVMSSAYDSAPRTSDSATVLKRPP
jgi:hypothetical protein